MWSTSSLSRPYINRSSEEFAQKSDSTSFNSSFNSSTSTTAYSESHSRGMEATSIDNKSNKRRKSDGGGGPIYCLTENWVLYSLWDTKVMSEFQNCKFEAQSTLHSPRTRFQCRILSERRSTFLNLVFKTVNSYFGDFPKYCGKDADARIFALNLVEKGDRKGTEMHTPAKFYARELGFGYGGFGISEETLLFGGYLALALCQHPSKNFDDLLIVLPANELDTSAAAIGVNLRADESRRGKVTLIRICACPQLEENHYPEISLMEKITPLLIEAKSPDMKMDRFKYNIVTLSGKTKREVSKTGCEFFSKHYPTTTLKSRSMINEGEEEEYIQLPLSGYKDPLNIYYLIMEPKLNTTFVKDVDTTKEYSDKSDFSEDVDTTKEYSDKSDFSEDDSKYLEVLKKSRDEMVPIFAEKHTPIKRSKSVQFKEPNVIKNEVASKGRSLAWSMVHAFIFLFLICALIIGSCFFCSGNNCTDTLAQFQLIYNKEEDGLII